jgi:hypothetical protein
MLKNLKYVAVDDQNKAKYKGKVKNPFLSCYFLVKA